MEFIQTNLHDILAYVLIVFNAILYLINNRHTKVSTASLSSSLTTFVKNKIQDQATLVEQTVQNFSDKINQGVDKVNQSVKEHTVTLDQKVKDAIGRFQETSFRQLADEIIALKQNIADLKQDAQNTAAFDKKIIADQSTIISKLQEDLVNTNNTIKALKERVTAEAEANQQRYIKLRRNA